jgi:hypothetical protein
MSNQLEQILSAAAKRQIRNVKTIGESLPPTTPDELEFFTLDWTKDKDESFSITFRFVGVCGDTAYLLDVVEMIYCADGRPLMRPALQGLTMHRMENNCVETFHLVQSFFESGYETIKAQSKATHETEGRIIVNSAKDERFLLNEARRFQRASKG